MKENLQGCLKILDLSEIRELTFYLLDRERVIIKA